MRGNKRPNLAAIFAMDLIPDKFKIPYTDLKPKWNNFFHAKSQQSWNNNIRNKLSQIKFTLEE